MTEWNAQKSAELYGIKNWGAGYFGVNSAGNVAVHPLGPKGPQVDLYHLIQDLEESGIRLPILLRFPEIIKARIELLNSCFTSAIEDSKYNGAYCGVFPIKVNQQRHLVEEIVRFGQHCRFGLECGSKPELLITLALMDTPNAVIVCNGFKDPEYIEMALISTKLGKQTFVVVDRMSELSLIVEAAKRLDVKPKIGFRAKLNTPGSGRWAESSGAKSKFGLTPSEIVHGIEYLKEQNMLNCLELLHFHIGSQIPSIQSIKGAIKEAARMFTELHAMGARPSYIDVGGGLGVDYDGSGKSESSTNYSEQEYANDIVSTLQSICDERGVPHPNIVSESGRSIIAHSSALIFDVLGNNDVSLKDYKLTNPEKDSRLVQDLWDIYKSVTKDNINEFYNDLIEKKRDTLQLFTYGVLSLEQRAKADDLFWAISTKMLPLAKEIGPNAEDIQYALEQELSDSYFCNFSVFQSLPDSWALEQLFPIMPIHRLDKKPDRRTTIVDLTCDSDGHISNFIDTETGGVQKYVEVHALEKGRPYYMGAFLTGAYQEILGDLHNLFGDTDAVHVTVTENGYSIDHVVEGDSVAEVLSYVEYNKGEMLDRVRRATEGAINKGTLSRLEARLLLQNYERGLNGYTYLREPNGQLELMSSNTTEALT